MEEQRSAGKRANGGLGGELAQITDVATRLMSPHNREAAAGQEGVVEFAGFLAREDDHSLCVADSQGTWVVRRSDVTSIRDWDPEQDPAVPEAMREAGRPIRFDLRIGAIIHEVRPWFIRRGNLGGRRHRAIVEQVFTLAGESPDSARAIAGEAQVALLERAFARRRGFAPEPDPAYQDPRGGIKIPPEGCSQTIVLYDGYCDVDEPF